MRFAEMPGPVRFALFFLPLAAGFGGLAIAVTLLPARTSAIHAAAGVVDGITPVDAAAPPPGLLVDVSGAVLSPGLYRVERGSRVYAAIEAAGGLAPDADPARLPDLAGVLRDGQQVKVAARAGGRAVPASARVDLNSATAEELVQVPGFTGDLAALAIEYRTRYGGFVTPRELVTVLGMDEASYQLAKRYVTA